MCSEDFYRPQMKLLEGKVMFCHSVHRRERGCVVGTCKAGGMHGGVWMAGGHVAGGVHAGETASEAGGTYPTGMHSCSFYI